ncbi:MAG: hypothetical protein ACRELY_17605, partial [Polyangiaceae bacterium]
AEDWPMKLAAARTAPILYAKTADGFTVSQSNFEFVFGPQWISSKDVGVIHFGSLTQRGDEWLIPAGAALVRAETTGSGIEEHPRVDNGRWLSWLDWRAVIEPGIEPLDQVIRAALARLSWREHASDSFEPWVDL